MKSATKKLFENEDYMNDHFSAVLDTFNRRANTPKKPPKAPLSIWDVEDEDQFSYFKSTQHIENLQSGTNGEDGNIIEKRKRFIDFMEKSTTFQITKKKSLKSNLVFQDIYFEDKQLSEDSLKTDVPIQTKTRYLTPEKHFPSKKQCLNVDFSLDVSSSEKTKAYLNSQAETKTNVNRVVQFNTETPLIEIVSENVSSCVGQKSRKLLELNQTSATVHLDDLPNQEKLQTEKLFSESPLSPNGEALAYEVLPEESDVVEEEISDTSQETMSQCESSQSSGKEMETDVIMNLNSGVTQEISKMAVVVNKTASQDSSLSTGKDLLWRSTERSSLECETTNNGKRNEKLDENLNWRSEKNWRSSESKLNNQTSWPSRRRNNSYEADTVENDYKDFSDWLKDRQQSWKSQNEINPKSSKCNSKIDNIPSKVESCGSNVVKENARVSNAVKENARVFNAVKEDARVSNAVKENARVSNAVKEDAHVSLNLAGVYCSRGDDSVICLLVTSSNGTFEVTVERKVLEHVQMTIPALTELVPRIEDSDKSLCHSAEAMVTFLRFIFSSPYKIQNWKIALELLYLGKKFKLQKLVKICEEHLYKCNPARNEMEEIIQYAKHFKIVKDLGKVFIPENPSAFQELYRSDRKLQIVASTCIISTSLYVEPFEFCIPLLKMIPEFKDTFGADIRNELLFESVKGSFCITGIQIKLATDVGKCEDKITIICDVFKGNEKLISEEKEKDSKSLIFLNFNKKVNVNDKEMAKIAVLIEDIPPCMCGRASNKQLIENVGSYNFVITLSTSKASPLIFIEKLFYTVNS